MLKNNLSFLKISKSDLCLSILIFLFFPIHSIIYLFAYVWYKKRYNFTQVTKYILVIINSIFLVIFVYFTVINVTFRNRQIHEISNYITFWFGKSQSSIFEIILQNINPERIGISLIGFNMIHLGNSYAETKLKRHSSLKEKDKFNTNVLEDKVNDIDFSLAGNIFFVGAPGSGKTANILRYVDNYLKRNAFIGIFDGKGVDAEFGLAWSIEKLAKKYNRKLYIIDQTNIDKSDAYNPFLGVDDPTQVKDMLLSMCSFSEEYYEIQCARFWQALAKMLILAGEDITFEKLVDFSNENNFNKLNKLLLKEEKITSKEYDLNFEICKSCIKTVESNTGRFSVIQEGVGKNIFRNDNSVKFEKALKENAIIIFKLNNFKYPKFSRELGKLAIQDLKNCIASSMNNKDLMDVEKFIVMDELHVYYDENTMQIINMGRDCNVTAGLATQGISDINMIDENLAGRIIDNCNNYVIMRVNNDETAEKMAAIIGTKKEVSTTYQTSNAGFGEKGTIKEIDQFKVHPNSIKELPKNKGYFYSKRNPRVEIKPFITKFIEV